MNWALNAYPLLHPGLSMLYNKMSRKSNAHQLIWVSVSLCRELSWFTDRVESSDGVHIMTSHGWGRNDAKYNLFCDACPIGLAFWFPAADFGFQHALSPYVPSPGIFFHESLAVVSALSWFIHNIPLHPRMRIAIYSDNSNTVDMFNSLRAQPLYNPLLITAIDLLLDHGVDLHVFHIPGQVNIVADALSRLRFDTIALYAPSL
jgi:hypothetical protein